LKNQVASTKGKTFQLDFNQPMVEDTNCKDKLREIANRVKQISSIDGYEPTGKSKTDSFGHSLYFRLTGATQYNVQIYSKDELNEVPEEVCCALIDMYKSTANNDYTFPPVNIRKNLQDYDLYVEKSRDNLNPGEDISTVLSIQKGGKNLSWEESLNRERLYLININAKIWEWGDLDQDRPNHNRKICEKLTKEYVKL
jgi:hypothetical protein